MEFLNQSLGVRQKTTAEIAKDNFDKMVDKFGSSKNRQQLYD